MADVFETFLSIFWFVIVTLPFYVAIRFFVYHRNKKLIAKRETAHFILYIFVLSIITQTLIPPSILKGDFSFNPYHLPGSDKIILNPLMLFDLIYNRSIVEHYYAFIILNLIGNILLFIPIGLLLPYLFKIKPKYAVLCGFSLSLFIELSQLFFDRTTDISDLILNTLGALIGALIYTAIRKRRSN